MAWWPQAVHRDVSAERSGTAALDCGENFQMQAVKPVPVVIDEPATCQTNHISHLCAMARTPVICSKSGRWFSDPKVALRDRGLQAFVENASDGDRIATDENGGKRLFRK